MAEPRQPSAVRPQLHHAAPAVIAACTAAREAGDWAGACRAAGLTPAVEPVLVAARWGEAHAQRVRADLAQLAPDLMRQYVRWDYRSWPSSSIVVLTDQATTPAGFALVPVRLPKQPVLVLTGPASAREGRGAHLAVTTPDRLPAHFWALPVWCWRADAVAERREAYRSGQGHARQDTGRLESGAMTPADLHPLVFAALHPDQAQPRAERAWQWPLVRVRCETVWHRLRLVDGRLVAHDHTAAQLRREDAMAAMGGPVRGCAAVLRTWRTGHGRLPKDLRRMRALLFGYAAAGHTDAVLSMLDAGFDPAVADGAGQTLLHLLPRLDHERLLPRLLAAGLPLDGLDKQGGTPLHQAAYAYAQDVTAALLEAGANPNVADRLGRRPTPERPSWLHQYAAEARAEAAPWPRPRRRSLGGA